MPIIICKIDKHLVTNYNGIFSDIDRNSVIVELYILFYMRAAIYHWNLMYQWETYLSDQTNKQIVISLKMYMNCWTKWNGYNMKFY